MYLLRTNFEDPSELAHTLKELATDDSKYAEYFWWKDYYSISTDHDNMARVFCDVCRRLHQDRQEQIYDDLEEWWVRKARCRPIRIKGA